MCGQYLFQQHSQTKSKSLFKDDCVGSICFSNTLKQKANRCSKMICVGSICFSNTLKPSNQLIYYFLVWVVFVLATLSNDFVGNIYRFGCGQYLFQQHSQTKRKSLLQAKSVGSICFSNTLKPYLNTIKKPSSVGSICFSNTLKRKKSLYCRQKSVGSICFSNTLKPPDPFQFGLVSVGSICFSNTLKHRIGQYDFIIVWVVFVLATLSNIS